MDFFLLQCQKSYPNACATLHIGKGAYGIAASSLNGLQIADIFQYWNFVAQQNFMGIGGRTIGRNAFRSYKANLFAHQVFSGFRRYGGIAVFDIGIIAFAPIGIMAGMEL